MPVEILISRAKYHFSFKNLSIIRYFNGALAI
jgi:hypothetical protein